MADERKRSQLLLKQASEWNVVFHNKHILAMPATLNTVPIVLFNESVEILDLPYVTGDIVENLVEDCLRHLNITPCFRPLFSLFHAKSRVMLSPSQLVQELLPSWDDVQLRVRFKPARTDLLRKDCRMLHYYFYQTRHDFLEHKFDLKPLENASGKVQGLVVTDALRYALEGMQMNNGAIKDEFYSSTNFKQFIPHSLNLIYANILNFRMHFEKPLQDAWNKCNGDHLLPLEGYIEEIIGNPKPTIIPDYHYERFQAIIGGCSFHIEFRPEDKSLYHRAVSDKTRKWKKYFSISEMCFISVQMTNRLVEVARKVGRPESLIFNSSEQMKSFVSLLDGYNRLSENSSFSLCSEIYSPSFAFYKALRCHGTVGRDFSQEKLLKKESEENSQFYLLRQSEDSYDEIYADVLMPDNEIVTFVISLDKEKARKIILSLRDNHMQKTDELHQMKRYILDEITKNLDEHMDTAKLKKLTCLPPSDYDKRCPLLLLCSDIRMQPQKVVSKSEQPPIIIKNENLIPEEILSERHSRNEILIQKALLIEKDTKRSVVMKTFTSDFLYDAARTWIHLKSDSIVNMIGMVLHSRPGISIVTDYYELGSLDKLLAKDKESLKTVHLVECGIYLARALWFMEENGLSHGSVRCRNLLVYEYTKGCAPKVKLADPVCIVDPIADFPWMPQEAIKESRTIKSLFLDIWAFATVLWEIFSYGIRPNEMPPRLRPLTCPSGAWDLMHQCWKNDPSDQILAQEIVRELYQVLHDELNLYPIDPIYTASSRKKANKLFKNPFANGSSGNRSSLHSANTLMTGLDSSRSELTSLGVSSYSLYDEITNDRLLLKANQLTLDSDDPFLGRGFYGEVLRATLNSWENGNSETVALKRITNHTALASKEIRKEIELLKTLDHKHIIKIKGFVEHPQLLLVMEYMINGSLVTFLSEKRKRERLFSVLGEAAASLKFASEISDGMIYLEQQCIVHRDLAARNILLDHEYSVKISDFGLAQQIPGHEYYRLRTQRGLPMRWYAPECIRHGRFSHKSDVWSFGVTLWEIYSYGQEPLYPGDDGTDDDEQLVSIIEKNVVLACPPKCPSSIYQIMLKCWHLNSDERPSFVQLKSLIDQHCQESSA